MPVHRSLNVQVVLDKDLDVVPFVDVDQRPRLLAVDEVHLPLESIYACQCS